MNRNTGFQIVSVKGNSREMGRQYGRQTSGLIRRYVAFAEALYKKIGYPKEDLLDVCYRYKDGIRSQAPELLDQFEGMAEGAKVKFERLMLATFHHEVKLSSKKGLHLTEALKMQSCTTYAASKCATRDGRHIIGQNSDSGLAMQDYIVITSAKPSDGYPYITVCHLGRCGGMGFNSEGLAIVASAVSVLDGTKALEKGKPLGLPVMFIWPIYKNCSSIDEAMEYNKMSPRGLYGTNRVIMDRHGDFVCAELSYEHYNLRYPDQDAEYPANHVIGSTNHFVSKEMHSLGTDAQMRTQLYENSCNRYDRIMNLLTANAGRIDFTLVKSFARDHFNGVYDSICRHGGDGYHTLFGIIIQPSQSRVWITKGMPCENEYKRFNLNL